MGQFGKTNNFEQNSSKIYSGGQHDLMDIATKFFNARRYFVCGLYNLAY